MFFPIPLPENGQYFTADNIHQLASRINLAPFDYSWMLKYEIPLSYIAWEVVGNILLTIPFGLGMSALARVRGWRLVGLVLLTGLTLELIQLVLIWMVGSYTHTVDINDVILNDLGVLIGAGLYWAAWRLFGRRHSATVTTR